MKSALACVLLVACTSAEAESKHKEAPPAATFDDVKSLDAFAKALALHTGGKPTRPLRIAYFGDSLTADDQITDVLRKRMQGLVGDGGAGYVFAAPPHPYCEHRAVTRVATNNWRVWGLSTATPNDHLLGLGGSAETDDDGAIAFAPNGPVGSVDVAYLAQPHGGSFDVPADGKSLTTVATSGEAKKAEYARVDVPTGTKKLRIQAKGKVRLFGATLEAGTGAVVDNLGVVNATAKQLAQNDMPEHLKGELAHRDADLVVIMLGTNEAEWLTPKSSGMEEHEKLFGEILQTVKDGTPHGSCLVISPLDQLDWRQENMPARTSVPSMVEAQRRAAHAHGCAFWDTYAWMGGKGSSRDWFRKGWVVKDFQHPTTEGAERIAEALFAGLTALAK